MSCPICKKPAVQDYRPFCSRRCADVDLGRWFNESYTIPQALTDVEPEDEAAALNLDAEHGRDE